MHWILQENLFKEAEWDTLVGTLERFQIPFSVHKVVPFVGELIPEPVISHKNVICFGAYSMRHTAKRYGWNPGVFDLFDYNFLVQKEHWGNHLLNFDADVVQFKNAVIDKPTFIRPIDDSKYFAGRVFEPDEFNTWREGICESGDDYGNGLSPETLLQLCKPKKIYAEYRFWIVNGAIITYSQYKRGDRVIYSRDVDSHIIRYASSVGRGIRCIPNDPLPWLPKAFVLDVCETSEGMKIVEINTICCSGFYAADMQKLIIALEESERSF